MWSLGVVMYSLLGGYPPFVSNDHRILFELIQSGNYEYQEKDWCHVSENAKFLISRLLEVDPSERYTARQVLESNWIKHQNIQNLSMHDYNMQDVHQKKEDVFDINDDMPRWFNCDLWS